MLKINLGCGYRLFPSDEGWVNVDIMDADAHMEQLKKAIEKNLIVPPTGFEYVTGAAIDLPFPEGSADLIYTSHLFEHIQLNEVIPTVQNWYKTLKNGGQLTVECPDAYTAWQLAIEAHDRQDGEAYMMAMRTIYGLDGTEKNVTNYMRHAYGWTPRTITQLLEYIGFKDVRVSHETENQVKRDVLNRMKKVRVDWDADFLLRDLRATGVKYEE